ncbi:hypothetical protein LEP1GSC073_0040 [Leptospira noguchii str. Cascata]|nr:hypothetical protein LEP1GSC073_0040 [Leptospira noguchii str. Cascata]
MSVGISERGGATVDVGFNKSGFNAGLSYNSKTGKASGSVGFTTEGGTGFALSYSEGDGFGASISKGFDNGVNGSLSWSQKGGVGGSIGYEVPADKNKPKDPLANKMQGAGGSLNFSQRDGVSASFNTSGGVNAGNWSQSGGFQANTNFLADKWKAEYQAEQAAIEQAKADSKAAQNKNNEETGKSVLDGAAIEVENRKRENGGDDNHYYDKDGNMRIRVTDSNGDSYYRAATPEEAHRVQNGNGLTMASDKGVTISNNNDKISLGNMDVKINKGQEGESFFKTKPKGLQGSETDKVFTNMHDPNQKIDKINWDYNKDNSMHNSKQKGQADLYAKEGTPLSIVHSQDGRFQLLKIENRGEMGGNSALVQFKDTNGETRQIRFNHLQDSFPSYVKEHFKNRDAGPLEMQKGTVFGRVGTTGNMWVGNVTKPNGITGPNSHTHIVLYEKPKVNYEGTSVPDWLKPAIGFDGNMKNGAK